MLDLGPQPRSKIQRLRRGKIMTPSIGVHSARPLGVCEPGLKGIVDAGSEWRKMAQVDATDPEICGEGAPKGAPTFLSAVGESKRIERRS